MTDPFLDAPIPEPERPKRQLSAKIALASCVIVVIFGAFGFWWVVLRDTAPPRAEAPVLTESDIPADAVVPPTADGTWTVFQGDDSFVGYRIKELFGGETFTKTAVGRTTGVTGSMVVDGSTIVDVRITADMTQMKSAAADRDATQQKAGLQIETYPEASFTLTAPIALPSVPTQGQELVITAVGDLTLHGVTKQVELSLKGTWNGATITVGGSAPVVLADFDIVPPASDLVGVEDAGEIEVALVFVYSGPAAP